MKKLLIGMLVITSFASFAKEAVKGKCSSLQDSKRSLAFDLVQTSFEKQTYIFKGSVKSLFARKDIEIESRFLGVYKNQFYSFSFEANFIKDSTNLLIRKEEFRNGKLEDDAFIVNAEGLILESLTCTDLNN